MASIRIDLAPEIIQQLQAKASGKGLDLGVMLADAVTALLGTEDLPIADMSDEQVLTLCDGMMAASQQVRLSELLGLHGEGGLGTDEQVELDRLMQVYRSGLVRKAEAWKVAVERGLRDRLG